MENELLKSTEMGDELCSTQLYEVKASFKKHKSPAAHDVAKF